MGAAVYGDLVKDGRPYRIRRALKRLYGREKADREWCNTDVTPIKICGGL